MTTTRGPRRSPRGAAIEQQYRAGLTMREIAAYHSISKAAVSAALKRRGASPTYEEWHRRVTAVQRASASKRARKETIRP